VRSANLHLARPRDEIETRLLRETPPLDIEEELLEFFPAALQFSA